MTPSANRSYCHDNMSSYAIEASWDRLDRNSGVPLHVQLRNALQQQITEGSYRPGEAFLTEREIAARYHVSRTTIREALVDLANGGYLVRQQGKGTFVARTRDAFDATRLSSFSEDMWRRGLRSSSRLLQVTDGPPAEDVAAHFGSDVRLVRRIDRLRFAGDEPISLQQSHLPLPRLAVSAEDLGDDSLYRLLEARFGVFVTTAEEVISAEVASTVDANLLGIAEGAPLLCVRRFAFSQTGEPIESACIRYRADKYKFYVQQTRGV
ncbi:MAG: GntR family transcriptional regulator [Trueperaceae bacterium]|nr:GntR family transcriptional regulator [Trueperaceae bacterium]